MSKTDTQKFFLDAGVDWLTLTTPAGASHVDDVIDIWRFLQNRAENEGHTRKLGGLQGYRGTWCEKWFYGNRGNEYLFQVTGFRGTETMELLREVDFRGNIPRLDVQNTIDGEKARAKTVQQLRRDRAKHFARGDTHKARCMATYEGAEGDDSFYLGSPTSSSRLVVYDAHAVHPERYREGAKRYEARFKKRSSYEPFARLKASKNIASTCKQIVVGKCQDVGIKERWQKGVPPIKPMSGTVKTDDEKSLAWLRTNVNRTTTRLYHRGRAEEIAEELNIVGFFLKGHCTRVECLDAINAYFDNLEPTF